MPPMPTAFDKAVPIVITGGSPPTAAPDAANTLSEAKANQWRVRLLASGSDVVVSGLIRVWWFDGKILVWDVLIDDLFPTGETVLDGRASGVLVRAPVDGVAVHMEIPTIDQPGNLSGTLQPIVGGS